MRPDTLYISAANLQNLKLYKYSCIDKSPFSKYVLRPYWDWAVTLFPMTMAPNLITLTGFLFVLFNWFCVLIFDPTLSQPGPRILYVSYALGLWLYSTFDNVDGRQARRTGTSSPLGELFDHGFDALNCSFGAVVISSSLLLGQGWSSVFTLSSAVVAFYISTWEEYHTKTLYLGYFNGPTEGLTLACLLMLMSGIFGPQFWQYPLNDYVGGFPDSWTLSSIVVAATLFLAVVIHTPFSLYNVWIATKKDATRFKACLAELIPIVSTFACTFLWLSGPNSVLLQHHLILFIMTIGVVFGQMATKIILAHVTSAPFPMMNYLILPLAVGAIIANIPRILPGVNLFTPTAEVGFVVMYLIGAWVAYVHWAVSVIGSICDYLGIKCLRIPHHDPSVHGGTIGVAVKQG